VRQQVCVTQEKVEAVVMVTLAFVGQHVCMCAGQRGEQDRGVGAQQVGRDGVGEWE
jgi:hypothetical protein